jgi:hypothetical protein
MMMKILRRIAAGALLALSLGSLGCGSGGGIGTVTGRVLDTTDQPLGGVAVTVQNVTAVTDAFGNFVLPNVPSGTWQVTASLDGYGFDAAAVAVTANASSAVNVVGRDLNQPPVLTAQVSATTLPFTGGAVTVDATATDADGQPLVVTVVTAAGTTTLAAVGQDVYRGTVTLPANDTYAAQTHTLQVVATDGRGFNRVDTSVVVQGLQVPTDVGGSQTDTDGGPPVPNIR